MGSLANPPARNRARRSARAVAATAMRVVWPAAVGATWLAAVLALAGAASVAASPADSTAFTPTAGDSTTTPTAPPTAPSPGGPVPTAQPAGWETLSTGLPEEARLEPLVRFRYNRVDGPAALVGVAVREERFPLPLLRALVGYAFSRERFLAEAGVDVPFAAGRRFHVGGSAYRRTASEDGWIVGETENTIFALVARTDYRDYYEAEGFEGHAGWRPGTDVGLTAGAVVEDQRSLRTRTRIALFGKDDRFRENPPIDSGEDGVVWGAVRIGPAAIPVAGGSRVEARYERSGGPLDRDFDYGRLRVQGNWRQRLAPGLSARARAIVASTRTGILPPQKVWNLGGIGTLRGEPFQSFRGDQFFLANAEIAKRARKNLDAFAFLDWGAAWFGRDAWDEARPALDGGVGLRVGEGPTAITVARNLQRGDAPFIVGVRLGGTWE